jgi:hypothetical protein
VTTQTLTLAEFLLARIAEDERAADEATMATWEQEEPVRVTITALSPDLVRLDCKIKRQMIKRAQKAIETGETALQTFGGDEPHHRVERASYLSTSMTWQQVLRLLALRYAGHPDYRQEWKP